MKQHFQSRMAQRGEGGFTLVELLVVIAILGILSAVVVFAVGNTTDKAQEKACKTERQTIRTAVEAFRSDDPNNAFPASLAALGAAGGYLDAETAASVGDRWTEDFAAWGTDANNDGLDDGLTGKGKCAGF